MAVDAILHCHDTTQHDSGVAVLLPDGEIVAIASERIGDRLKHDGKSGPADAFLRARLGLSGGILRKENDFFREIENGPPPGSRHHLNHAASTFLGSGFNEAAILVVDGQGPEDGVLATTTLWHGTAAGIAQIESLHSATGKFAECSVGHFYTAIGALAGIDGLHAEGKTMGLAAYGRPSRFLSYLQQHVAIHDDGTYQIAPELIAGILRSTLGAEFYGWAKPTGKEAAIVEELHNLRRVDVSNQRPNQDDADIAYAGQYLLEQMLLGLARRAAKQTGSKRLCLAGGVALNCVANEKIRASGLFEDVYVFPAAGDDGQAIGKLYLEIHVRGLPVSTLLRTPYLGPPYTPEEYWNAVNNAAGMRVVADNENDTMELAAEKLSSGLLVACCRGRSEIGPRALGHRSIFGDPRRPELRDRLNFFVKNREWYRPVAPIIREDAVGTYFCCDRPSPHMTFAVSARPIAKAMTPAVVHADGTARVQTVSADQEPFLFGLLSRFADRTGVPALINTSFNGRSEPLVETPADAIATFARLPLDAMILGDILLEKEPI